MVGIPNPPVDREQLQIVNQDLAHDITMNNERTLNARGVRIMLDQQDLAELGYEHIEFRRDRFRGSIDVELCVHNEQYQITLDRNLNLDLEGKQIHSLALQENLHYLVLSALRPVLCEKIENENESDWGEETRTVITRMGHYRLLPSGQHFSDYAAANCQEYDGKDLRVRDFMKTEEQRRNGTSEEGIRHLTYVKPLESDVEEQLPPVELHLPRPIAFE